MNLTTSISPAPLQTSTNDRWLRAAMLIDALVTGANGLAYVAGATLLTNTLGPSTPSLIGIGAFLTCYAVVIVFVGRAQPIPVAGVWFAIVMNVAWTLTSVVVAFEADWLTTTGRVWDVLQALVVLAFAGAQFVGARRARP